MSAPGLTLYRLATTALKPAARVSARKIPLACMSVGGRRVSCGPTVV